jgi:predicted DNA-binding transcriptional regulator YafY
MRRASTLGRLQRLELLTAELKSGEALTAGGLADRLGVSLRTLNRDLALLREQGLPVEADRGRGGGLRLSRRWGVGRIALTYGEAVDLLVSLAMAEQMESPLLMAGLAGVRRKLTASFAPEMAARINGLKARIRVGKPAAASVLVQAGVPGPEVAAELNQAFLGQQALSIRYRAVDGRVTEREIEPHYLLLAPPIWYVLAWDGLRRDARTFRCDRIVSAVAREGRRFDLLPMGRFEAALEGIETV